MRTVLIQLLGAVQEISHRRHEPFPLGREAHTGVTALYDGKAQLLLQTVDAVGHSGLGTAKLGSRPGETAYLYNIY